MDRTLVLLRHAKSSWNDPTLGDFERPLSRRGQRAAPAIASHLAVHSPAPDLVLCSPAQRALETWFHLAPHYPKTAVEMLPALYMAEVPVLLQTLQGLAETVRHALIIGHNPGLHELALALCGSGPERQMKRLRDKFPTAAYAEIALTADAWPAVMPAAGALRHFVRPRDLE